ncbi:MAG: pyridoxal-phosphate dependent enzyme [candidate division Zixibacteria bacterium]|nr:pyridoxal-phosphate dependent enzyme [candidate division Zixibacteria bacterium]
MLNNRRTQPNSKVSLKDYPGILDIIGNTPVVKLSRVFPFSEPAILAKLEFFSPGGSVKDRLALSLIEEAEKKGELKPGGTVVECTSGNCGISVAMVAALKGYRCIIVMEDKNSKEKQDMIRAFGAELVLVKTGSHPDSPKSNYNTARRIANETEGAVYLDQFNNPANFDIHYRTTAKEIWEQTGGELDFFIAGIGTGGTISGVSSYLKEKNPGIKIFGVDIEGSVYTDYYYKGVMNEYKVYKVEGIGGDNIPGNVQFDRYDEIIRVSDRESFQWVNRLCREEGIFGGSSTGAVTAAIAKSELLFKDLKLGAAIFADSGYKYLSKQYSPEWMTRMGFNE